MAIMAVEDILRSLTIGILLASAPAALRAQPVPEGIHNYTRAPSTLCGITGRDALDLRSKVMTDPKLAQEPSGSERFELYSTADAHTQWVFTTPGEAAYPAATCRRLHNDAGGDAIMERKMRCDGAREACDKLFIEFQELDARARQLLEQSASADLRAT